MYHEPTHLPNCTRQALMNTEGISALVTGGASGLGLATVHRLHAAGASVVIADLPSSQGEAIAKSLGERVRFAPA
ncbi:SDR family NAD(P)-dependent oxidoreductase, partial [Phenylobacterium sp.]|uniref:SDR family NAD(P)-dependent oxidoreductase n=1 Tax=Phenylobacterium sp. TaxID=1871053 RepID=UPI00403755BD